jgi:hypothetical protein
MAPAPRDRGSTLSSLATDLDAGLRRLGLQELDVGLVPAILAPCRAVLAARGAPELSRTVAMARAEGRALCAALDLLRRTDQARRAEAAHNPALFIGFIMFS